MTIWNNGEETESLYYTHDLQKNVTALFGQAAGRRAQYEHDPYGNPINTTGDAAGINPYRYSSEYHDEDLGLIYYNYRHYNPTDGRWINRDPIAEQGGRNLYGFVGNRAGWFGDWLGLVGTCKYIGEKENSILERYTNFVYIEPKSSNDYMITSIWSFVSEQYPKNTTLLYPSDSLLSKRFWESPMLKPFRIMFDEWDDFCDCFPNEIYESKYHRYAYTAPSREMRDSAATLGVHQDGVFYGDFGTLFIGSFGIEISFVIDCQNCMKSLNLFVYNSWSVASATRHPVTRKPLIEKEYVHTLNTIFHIKKASKIKNCQPK